MAATGTDLNIIRLLIADTDPDNWFFNDEQLGDLFELAEDEYTTSGARRYRSAALALTVGATNQIFVKGKTQILDTINLDGVTEARALRLLADDYNERAAKIEAENKLVWFEVIVPS